MSPIIRKTIYAFIAVATLATLYLLFDSVTDRVTEAEQDNASTSRALAQANAKVTALGRQVRGLGEAPVVSTAPVKGPQYVPGPAGATGQTGVAGQTGATGSSGTPGRNGQNGATGQSGAAGATGPKGDTGATGAAGKDGADGKNGTDGTNGKDGRGIDSVSCEGLATGTFTFTFSDGTSQQVTCGAP